MGDGDDVGLDEDENVDTRTQAEATEASNTSRRKTKAKAIRRKASTKDQSNEQDTPAQHTQIIDEPSEPSPTHAASADTASINNASIDASQVQPPAQADAGSMSSNTPAHQITAYTSPSAIESINDLPSSIWALEELLPQFQAPLSVDTVEEDEENALARLALADVPDIPLYLDKSASILKTHREAITADDNSEALSQLEKREKAVSWYLMQYRTFGAVKTPYGTQAEKSTEAMSEPLANMDIDPEPSFTCALHHVSICFAIARTQLMCPHAS